jgi:hypothetical protein
LIHPASTAGRGLPRRDWLLLPLLSFATLVILFGISECISRFEWREQQDDPCYVVKGPLSHRYRPGCVSSIKTAEGPWVENRFNECGYRTAESCGTKPAGTVRIVLLGSSMSAGHAVAYEETFAAQTAAQLTQIFGRPTQVQNLGARDDSMAEIATRIDEAVQLQPDLIVQIVTPYDIENFEPPDSAAEKKRATAPHTPQNSMMNTLLSARAVTVAKHFLYLNPETLLRLYAAFGDATDILHSPLSSVWKERFAKAEVFLSRMARQFRRERIPFMIIPVPTRAGAVIMNARAEIPSVDAWLFGKMLKAIADRQEIAYVDTMEAFAQALKIEELFYPVDGHLTGTGNALLAHTFVEATKRGETPQVLETRNENPPPK